MVKIIVACLFLALGVWGCDGDRNQCVRMLKVFSSDCVAVAMLDACEPFLCGFSDLTQDPPIVVDFIFPNPSLTCEAVDCETIVCGEGFEILFNPTRFVNDGNEFLLSCT